jgi:adenosylmethionine-8-amino-7-oxononanoate aminotransferase
VPSLEYLRRVRALCDAHDVLFVADEVLAGAGRTGTWSALEPFGVVPDVMVLGKGIAGGYAPLSAVLAPRRIVDVLATGEGALSHAQTFSHHPVLAAAGVATIRYLRAHDLVRRCAEMGRVLHGQLRALLELPHVGDVRGRGLLAGIELVADRGTREPFAREECVAERITGAALDAGLVVWPNLGHLAGGQGDIIMVAPPFIISEDEIAELVRRLRVAISSLRSAA